MMSQRFSARSTALQWSATRRRVVLTGVGSAALAALGLGRLTPDTGAFKSLSGCKKHCKRFDASCQHDCQQCCKKVIKGNQHRCDFGCGYIKKHKK